MSLSASQIEIGPEQNSRSLGSGSDKNDYPINIGNRGSNANSVTVPDPGPIPSSSQTVTGSRSLNIGSQLEVQQVGQSGVTSPEPGEKMKSLYANGNNNNLNQQQNQNQMQNLNVKRGSNIPGQKIPQQNGDLNSKLASGLSMMSQEESIAADIEKVSVPAGQMSQTVQQSNSQSLRKSGSRVPSQKSQTLNNDSNNYKESGLNSTVQSNNLEGGQDNLNNSQSVSVSVSNVSQQSQQQLSQSYSQTSNQSHSQTQSSTDSSELDFQIPGYMDMFGHMIRSGRAINSTMLGEHTFGVRIGLETRLERKRETERRITKMCNYMHDAHAIYKDKKQDLLNSHHESIDRQSVKYRLERIANRKGCDPDDVKLDDIKIPENDHCQRLSDVYEQHCAAQDRKNRWIAHEHKRRLLEAKERFLSLQDRSKSSNMMARRAAMVRGVLGADRVAELEAYLALPFKDRLMVAEMKRAENQAMALELNQRAYGATVRRVWTENAAKLEKYRKKHEATTILPKGHDPRWLPRSHDAYLIQLERLAELRNLKVRQEYEEAMWRMLELDAKHKALVLKGKVKPRETMLRLYQEHFAKICRREELVREHELANEEYLKSLASMRQKMADIFPFLPKRTGIESSEDLYTDYKRRQEIMWRRRAAAERAESDAIAAGRAKVFNMINANWERLGLPDLNVLSDVNGGRAHLTTASGRPISTAITRRQFFSDTFDYLHHTKMNYPPHPAVKNPYQKAKTSLRPSAVFERLYNDDLDFKARRAQIGLARVLLEEKEREKRQFLRDEYARRRYAKVCGKKGIPRDPKSFYAKLHSEGEHFHNRRLALQDEGVRKILLLEADRYKKRGEMLRSKLLHMTRGSGSGREEENKNNDNGTGIDNNNLK